MNTPFELPSLRRCVRVLKLPLLRWMGNCYIVADLMVEKKLVPGWPVFGHYLGPIDSGSIFDEHVRDDVSFMHLPHTMAKPSTPGTVHGWIRTPDGMLVDPTRWVFENVRPYLYVAETSHSDYCECVRSVTAREAGVRLKRPELQSADETFRGLLRRLPRRPLYIST